MASPIVDDKGLSADTAEDATLENLGYRPGKHLPKAYRRV